MREKTEGGKDGEMRRKSRRENLNSTWEGHTEGVKPKMGLTGLCVLDGVVSSVLSSSVVLC